LCPGLDGQTYFLPNTLITLSGDFRPLREYQGSRLQRAAQPSVSEGVDAVITLTPEEEQEELMNPMQLSLFLEEENDL
jgi:hypothetical protein